MIARIRKKPGKIFSSRINRLSTSMWIDDPQGLEKLLEYTDGKYMVPVIVNVDEGNAEIGYTGD